MGLLALVIVIALLFDFTNGFHDTANSIATLVGTRALDPQKAVLLASAMNFVGAFWSLKVAGTITGIVPNWTLNIVLAGLVGAIVWNLMTWHLAIPSSSSHALVGGMIGAALIANGSSDVAWGLIGNKIVQPAVLAPVLGGFAALALMAIMMNLFKNSNPTRSTRMFRRMQLFSGGWLAFTHGTNDAQKTMGIIAACLIATHHLTAPAGGIASPPMWVVFSAATAMSLGTYAGGWKIIKTLGGKIVKMSPMQGFAASLASAAVLQTAASLQFPVSTTHCVSGSVLGAGTSRRLNSVRWTVAFDIVTAWVITLPCAALVGAGAYSLAAISPAVLLIVGGGITLYIWSRMRASKTAYITDAPDKVMSRALS
jgi:PiT family inorganic phosphate transporter